MKKELDSGLENAGMAALGSPELCSEFLTQDTSTTLLVIASAELLL